jgi:hypothetical protein
MALNPPISPQGIPLRVEGESFLLERKSMEIEVKIDSNKEWGKKTGKGKVYLTSCRLVFVNEKFHSSDFKSFDIPLIYLSKEKFE